MELSKLIIKQGNYLFKYRSYFPVLLLIPSVLIYTFNYNHHSFYFNIKIFEIIAFAISVMGLMIRFLTIGYSADHTSGRNTSAGQIAESLNTKGMYSICRHPLYLGNFLMWFGLSLFTQNLWFILVFILVFGLYYERIIFAEEAFLSKKFEKYSEWSSIVPSFIPNFALWKTPDLPFSFVKIVRQEKSTILNLFFVVFIFKFLATYASHVNILKFEKIWVYLFIVSIAYYSIIKLVQINSKYILKDR